MATAAASNDRLGDILIREGLITREQLSAALSEQKSTGHRLGFVLVKLGLVQELEVTKVLARQYRMRFRLSSPGPTAGPSFRSSDEVWPRGSSTRFSARFRRWQTAPECGGVTVG